MAEFSLGLIEVSALGNAIIMADEMLKAADVEFINAGSIIYRQRGTKIHPGTNVRRGKDDTLFATISGYVRYEHMGKDKTKVSVYLEK